MVAQGSINLSSFRPYFKGTSYSYPWALISPLKPISRNSTCSLRVLGNKNNFVTFQPEKNVEQ